MSDGTDIVVQQGRPIAEWAGARLCLAQGKVHVARALLAVRRGDRLTAEVLLVNAQRDLARAEIVAGELTRTK
jgi:hypothetical protein